MEIKPIDMMTEFQNYKMEIEKEIAEKELKITKTYAKSKLKRSLTMEQIGI